MNAFEQASNVDAMGRAVLLPFLEEHSSGHLVLFDKGPLSKAAQETHGDAVLSINPGRPWFVEIKTERRHTGNLFLETWSNRNLDDRNNHAKFGCNVGWLQKLVADLLLYYFLDADALYVFDLFKLKRWAFVDGRIYAYQEICQRRYNQKNDTWGRIVPLADLREEVGFTMLRPKSAISNEWAAA